AVQSSLPRLASSSSSASPAPATPPATALAPAGFLRRWPPRVPRRRFFRGATPPVPGGLATSAGAGETLTDSALGDATLLMPPGDTSGSSAGAVVGRGSVGASGGVSVGVSS